MNSVVEDKQIEKLVITNIDVGPCPDPLDNIMVFKF